MKGNGTERVQRPASHSRCRQKTSSSVVAAKRWDFLGPHHNTVEPYRVHYGCLCILKGKQKSASRCLHEHSYNPMLQPYAAFGSSNNAYPKLINLLASGGVVEEYVCWWFVVRALNWTDNGKLWYYVPKLNEPGWYLSPRTLSKASEDSKVFVVDFLKVIYIPEW